MGVVSANDLTMKVCKNCLKLGSYVSHIKPQALVDGGNVQLLGSPVGLIGDLVVVGDA